ncbi:MAG: FG-GAP repeat protein, partial [Chloroflexota bacterium]
VVGSPYADAGPGAQNHGAAYVYVNEGGLWKQQQKLVAGDGQEYDHFGQSVALDGGTIMIGSDRHNGNGAVYVFTRSGGMWNKQQKLVAGDNQSWGYFGASLALEGDTAMIGAPGSYGAVYVFERSGASWTGSQKLVAGDPFDFSQFGGSIALDGDTALIGASYQEAAYIFGWDGSKWLEKQKIVDWRRPSRNWFQSGRRRGLRLFARRERLGADAETDPAPWSADVFGYPALDGSRVLIGAPGDDYYCSGVRHFAYFFEGEKLMQYITFPRPSGGEIGESILLKAEASSGLPVVYVSKTPAVCSSSDGLAVLLANGVCRITASQMGDNVYAPAQDAEVEFAIGASAYQLYLPAFPGDRTDE